jgi:hypothetical protein
MASRYFPATAEIKASYSYIDGSNRPIVFVGGVTVSDTADRLSPPDPICGMKLDYTSLGNGHIMALQLGGPDVSENIVPQYQQWQQTGRWRTLEKDAMTYCAAGSWIFVAYLHYDNTHKSGKDHKAEFASGHTTIFWDDPRIPTVFDIWLIQAASAQGQAITKDILSPTVKDADRLNAAAGLPLALTMVPLFRKNADQATEMPEEDRNFWRKNQLARVVESMFEEYQEDREDQVGTARSLMDDHGIGPENDRDKMASVLLSPVRETEFEFVDGYGDTIRKQLDLRGWDPAEVTEYGTNMRMLEAVFHKKQLSKIQKDSNKSRTEAYDTAYHKSQKTRTSYAVRDAPYGKMSDTFKRGYKGDQFEDDSDKYLKRLERHVDGLLGK